jgi:hypothetical protein
LSSSLYLFGDNIISPLLLQLFSFMKLHKGSLYSAILPQNSHSVFISSVYIYSYKFPSKHALTASHKFYHILFLLTFVLRHFLIYFVISFLTYCLILYHCTPHTCKFSSFPFVTDFKLYSINWKI